MNTSLATSLPSTILVGATQDLLYFQKPPKGVRKAFAAQKTLVAFFRNSINLFRIPKTLQTKQLRFHFSRDDTPFFIVTKRNVQKHHLPLFGQPRLPNGPGYQRSLSRASRAHQEPIKSPSRASRAYQEPIKSLLKGVYQEHQEF